MCASAQIARALLELKPAPRGCSKSPMSRTAHTAGAPWRNFYGRRHGKGLRESQKRALERDLGAVELRGVGWDENPDRKPLDLEAVFGGRPVWLEIGFGGGEHLVHLAETHPDVGLIGCEPFINGVAMLLRRIAEAGAGNIRIYPDDARHLFDVLPEGSVGRTYLLYPDPWPKARHHRRRFVTPEHLEPLHRVMAPGAELRIATDIEDYVRQTLEEVPRAGFERICEATPGLHEPWDGWIRTRYEAKAVRAGRRPHYLVFRKP